MKTHTNFKTVLIVASLCIVGMFTNCNTPVHITSLQDVQTDFSKYKTFAWLPDKTDTTDLPYNNEIVRNNIRNCFGHYFAERGYSVNLESPDILLALVISSKKKEKVYSAYPPPYYYNRYYYGSIYYMPYYFDYYYRYYPSFIYPMDYLTQKYEYIEGSITLNVFDRAQNKLVWSGTARSDIFDPAYVNENIHPAIAGIMEKYPVKPVKKQEQAGS